METAKALRESQASGFLALKEVEERLAPGGVSPNAVEPDKTPLVLKIDRNVPFQELLLEPAVLLKSGCDSRQRHANLLRAG